jgi:hypothetical protein
VETSRGVLDLGRGQDVNDGGDRGLQFRRRENCRLERPDDQDRFRVSGGWTSVMVNRSALVT